MRAPLAAATESENTRLESGRNPLDLRKGRKPWRRKPGSDWKRAAGDFWAGRRSQRWAPRSAGGWPSIPQAHAQAAAPAAPKGPQYLKFPGKNDKLVVLGDRPLVAETPESLLDDDTTPIEKFYIRNNGQIPDETKDPDAWKITIDGEVNNKLEITLGELKSKYKAVTRRMVLECGGNGRAGFSPPARGNQWTNGGAGCAEWTGVRARRRAEGRGAEAEREIHRALCRRPASVGRCRQADRSRAACASRRRWTRNTLIVWAHERPAAAEHPRRAGAPDRAGLGRARRRRNG